MDALPLELIDKYARPMTIKITIIDYFYMEVPFATVSMKLNPNMQSTLMADDGLCPISGTNLDKKLEDAKVAKVGTPCV